MTKNNTEALSVKSKLVRSVALRCVSSISGNMDNQGDAKKIQWDRVSLGFESRVNSSNPSTDSKSYGEEVKRRAQCTLVLF